MELAGEKPGVVRSLDDFHIFSIRGAASDAEPGSGERFFVFAIKFVPVPVTFADFRGSVSSVGRGIFLDLAGPGAEAHGAAHFVHAEQLAQLVNHAMRRLRIEVGAVRAGEPRNVARIFNRRALHSQTYAEKRNLVRARIFDRVDHSLNAALAKSAGDQDTVRMLQSQRRRLARIDFFRFDPFDDGAILVSQAAVDEGFAQTFVGVFQLDVFAHYGDVHFTLRLANAVQ